MAARNLYDKDGANYNPYPNQGHGHGSGHGKVNADNAGAAKKGVAAFAQGLQNNKSETKKKQQEAKRAAVQNLIKKHGSGK